jgi:hypothetical protein
VWLPGEPWRESLIFAETSIFEQIFEIRQIRGRQKKNSKVNPLVMAETAVLRSKAVLLGKDCVLCLVWLGRGEKGGAV